MQEEPNFWLQKSPIAKQQVAALKLEFIYQQNVIDKYYYIKNELTNDEESFSFKGKGKGEKCHMRKACNLLFRSQKRSSLEEGGVERLNMVDLYSKNLILMEKL